MDDAQILIQFKNSSSQHDAFTQLVKKYQQKLYWHIRRLVIDHEDTNDVLQNTFIKVWNALSGFKGESQLYTWLYRIATNESLNFIEQKKRKTMSDINELSDEFMSKLKADPVFDSNRLECQLQLAIQQLPEKQKVVFNLRYYDEMSYEDMSRILETSAGALKASYHHAAKKVEDFIKKI